MTQRARFDQFMDSSDLHLDGRSSTEILQPMSKSYIPYFFVNIFSQNVKVVGTIVSTLQTS